MSEQHEHKKYTPVRGIGMKILAVAVFTLMATCIKAAAPRIPPGEAVFFRSFFAIPVIVFWLIWTQNLRHGLDTSNPMGHLWRGLVGASAMGLGFTALGLLPLPEAVAIGYAAPLLTVVFAAMFLGEAVRIYRISAVLVGLIGVMVVLSPRLTLLSGATVSTFEAVGAMAALLGAVFAALAQVFVRKLVHSEATPTIVFYFSLTATMLSLATLPFGWTFPNRTEAMLLVGAGVLGGIGQILLTESYRHAETSVIAPFEYVSMILALILGYVVFDELPTGRMLGGAGLIVSAGLFIMWREHRLGLERARARGAVTPQG
jgi:drug/metabolite transporter (DMT)-like permease